MCVLYLFHPVVFNMFMSYIELVYCKEHKTESFLIRSKNIYLLMDAFISLHFNVITDTVGYKSTIFPVAFYLFDLLFSFPLSLPLFGIIEHLKVILHFYSVGF